MCVCMGVSLCTGVCEGTWRRVVGTALSPLSDQHHCFISVVSSIPTTPCEVVIVTPIFQMSKLRLREAL